MASKTCKGPRRARAFLRKAHTAALHSDQSTLMRSTCAQAGRHSWQAGQGLG